mmetsp:Transcript_16753/g.26870  ORF Transcript_16753/g.26870 Transcript_16753/m.26870 type:complete len:85 (+) Transcript_16753:1778-2032(+)
MCMLTHNFCPSLPLSRPVSHLQVSDQERIQFLENQVRQQRHQETVERAGGQGKEASRVTGRQVAENLFEMQQVSSSIRRAYSQA